MAGISDEVEFVIVPNGEVQLRVATLGSGPLIVFVHGWPELWYSWRHQMAHVANHGYRAAALDVRGYGGSSKPVDIASYRLTALCRDVAAVIDALATGPAVVVGHDWGAPIAWNTARLHPSLVRAVAGLSVPYRPIGPQSPLELWEQLYAGRFFYMLYFQRPGVAEAELGADHGRSLRTIYAANSGDAQPDMIADKPPDAGLLDGLVDRLPDWLEPSDLRVYEEAFAAGGWTGPLNRYRAQGLDAAELGGRPDVDIVQPACFIAGALDPVRRFVPGIDVFETAGRFCRDFRGTTIVPGAGHWVQQEAPDEVDGALGAFLATL